MNNLELIKLVYDINEEILQNTNSRYKFEIVSGEDVELVEYRYDGHQRNILMTIKDSQMIIHLEHFKKFTFWNVFKIGSTLSKSIAKIILKQTEKEIK